ncbi:MAG: hypothetical protein EOO39_32410 [Cytophagaceae bacterium]|nr:MAG: hypothetical protein EOO39_32410 [Cytophagaceae bacterium]
MTNDTLERSTLRKDRLAVFFGPDLSYRELSLKALFTLSNVPPPDIRALSTVMLQFPMADSTGANTLRRWRGFTNMQLDSVIQLYDRVAYASRRNRLREALATLPPQLPWLPLLEPTNTKAYTVEKSIKKGAGIDTTLAITLRFAPNDTLGATLFPRLKTLSPKQRALYNRVNDAVRKVTDASVVTILSSSEDSITNQQFSRLIDSLTVRSAANPIKFIYAKGSVVTDNPNYTTEAAARRDINRMREMTADERMAFYLKRVDATPAQIASLNFFKVFVKKRSLNRYVQDFDKSESEIEVARANKVTKYISYSFFLLMPLVAWFLYLFYRRSKTYYYVDHLIFSVNIHTVLFILTILLLLLIEFTPLGTYTPANGAVPLFLPGPALYFLLSLRTVYKQSWGRTVVNFLGLTVLYSLAFVLLLGTASVIGLF